MSAANLILATKLGPENELVRAVAATGVVSRVVSARQDLSSLRDAIVLMINWPYILKPDFLDLQSTVVNIHNSLLPRYRGRHAFTWAMIHGETEVGYTLHQVDHGVDTGPIYAQVRIPVLADDDINILFARASETLVAWLPEQLKRLCSGALIAKAQEECHASYFKARTADDGAIRWQQPGRAVRDFVRALRPPYTPGAFVEWAGQRFIVDSCELNRASGSMPAAGTVVTVDVVARTAVVSCADGTVMLRFLMDKGPRTVGDLPPGSLLAWSDNHE